jgi:hypothetical protein
MKTMPIGVLLLPLLFSSCGWEDRMPAEMTSLSQSQPLGQEKSLGADIHIDVGALEIASETKPLAYSMDLEYDRASYRPDITYNATRDGEEGHLSFRLQGGRRAGMPRNQPSTRLRLGLSDTLPLNLNIGTGVGETRLALSHLKLARLELETGVGGARITAYDPNSITCESIRIKNGVGGMDATGLANLNFRKLEFEGGVGGAKLDFSGEWKHDASIDIQIGVGGVALHMPRDIGVRVEAERHFLSGLHLAEFSRRDSFYFSNNYDRTDIHVSVRVTTGVGGFRISWL